jgi:serine/threonine protein kinase
MAAGFDAYHKWLGIPPEEQPPHVYRLLGVKAFENDLDVIANAADARMAHLRSFVQGPQGPIAENLLNQIAAARLALLDPQKKPLYDQALKAYQTSKQAPAKTTGTPAKSPFQPLSAHTTDTTQGALFGEYVLFERIGGGRSGPIYCAKSRKTNQFVSMKILPPSAAKMPQVLKRFQREISLSSSLNHPNLVGCLGSGEQEGIHFMVLEQISGTDLAVLVSQHGPLDVPRAVNYTMQAAEGLAFLHSKGVYHRNIKPHNLLIDGQGVVRIANLTLAHIDEQGEAFEAQNDGLTKTGEMMGSVDYLAPEQASDASSIDQRADVYSLGCTLCHLLTGRPPYPGKSMMDKLVAHRAKPIPSLRELRPDVPKEVDQAFQKMMAKDRNARYANMQEVMAALGDKPAGSIGGVDNRLVYILGGVVAFLVIALIAVLIFR